MCFAYLIYTWTAFSAPVKEKELHSCLSSEGVCFSPLLPGLAYVDVAVCSPASFYHGLTSFSCITAAPAGLPRDGPFASPLWWFH